MTRLNIFQGKTDGAEPLGAQGQPSTSTQMSMTTLQSPLSGSLKQGDAHWQHLEAVQVKPPTPRWALGSVQGAVIGFLSLLVFHYEEL